MNKKISVVVPVYNVERYLKRCIDSIINQTYRNLEIILVNDGSTDDSQLICESYLEKDFRINLVNKINAGLGMARNTGIENATGEIILFIDGDDYIDHNMVEILYKEMLETKSDTCVGGFTRAYPDKLEPQPNPIAPSVFEGEAVTKELLVRMMGNSQKNDYIEMSACKVLFSMKLIEENHIRFRSEREFISEDLIFAMDYYRHAKRVYLSKNVGYYYCLNEGSLTTRYNPNRFELQVKLSKELLSRSQEIGIFDYARDRILLTLIAIARYSIKLEEKFSKENGSPKATANILKICNNKELQDALNRYDRQIVRFQSRLINDLMHHKQVRLLRIIMKLKNLFGI